MPGPARYEIYASILPSGESAGITAIPASKVSWRSVGAAAHGVTDAIQAPAEANSKQREEEPKAHGHATGRRRNVGGLQLSRKPVPSVFRAPRADRAPSEAALGIFAEMRARAVRLRGEW